MQNRKEECPVKKCKIRQCFFKLQTRTWTSTYSWDTFLGRGLGLGARGSEVPSSFMLPVRSWWGLGGRAGGSACGGMERLWGRGTGLRGLFLSYTL